ncbi:hypothetical protein M2321_003972 [Rhodoblastus acidophilus]|nr:gpW family head-tail joining protein [Rhodoblastus acidophilus]MCW2276367.1 hypothetical protein [Rhodoblastus acidophilus]
MAAVPMETLTQWLTEARTALHQLQIGRRSVEVREGEKWVTYTTATVSELRGYVARLEAQIANGGTYSPSGVGIVF